MANDSYSIENEEWRDVVGYEGSYRVSSLGRIYTFLRKPKIRKLKSYKAGYLGVRLQGPCGDKTILVHQIVCRAFHGPKPSDNHVVAHNDGCRTNNHASNLRWCTQSENLADRKLHGTTLDGERNGAAKLTTDDVFNIRRMASEGRHYKEIACNYTVREQAIRAVLTGKTWRNVL